MRRYLFPRNAGKTSIAEIIFQYSNIFVEFEKYETAADARQTNYIHIESYLAS